MREREREKERVAERGHQRMCARKKQRQTFVNTKKMDACE
jgi:hypothetical protein